MGAECVCVWCMEKCFHIKMVITENMAEKRWKIHPCIIQYAVNWTSAESRSGAGEERRPTLLHTTATTARTKNGVVAFFHVCFPSPFKIIIAADLFLSNLFANYFALGKTITHCPGLPAPFFPACIKHDKL